MEVKPGRMIRLILLRFYKEPSPSSPPPVVSKYRPWHRQQRRVTIAPEICVKILRSAIHVNIAPLNRAIIPPAKLRVKIAACITHLKLHRQHLTTNSRMNDTKTEPDCYSVSSSAASGLVMIYPYKQIFHHTINFHILCLAF